MRTLRYVITIPLVLFAFSCGYGSLGNYDGGLDGLAPETLEGFVRTSVDGSEQQQWGGVKVKGVKVFIYKTTEQVSLVEEVVLIIINFESPEAAREYIVKDHAEIIAASPKRYTSRFDKPEPKGWFTDGLRYETSELGTGLRAHYWTNGSVLFIASGGGGGRGRPDILEQYLPY